jgi:hypothetical protein
MPKVRFENGFINKMEISFGHSERERIVIAVPDQPSCFKSSSKDWFSANVDIQAGGFKGTVSTYLDRSDFERFLPQIRWLYETLKGEARFDTIERQIEFVLKGDGKGHITLSGFLKDRPDGNELSFELEFDQTLLKRSISEIETYLAAARTTL